MGLAARRGRWKFWVRFEWPAKRAPSARLVSAQSGGSIRKAKKSIADELEYKRSDFGKLVRRKYVDGRGGAQMQSSSILRRPMSLPTQSPFHEALRSLAEIAATSMSSASGGGHQMITRGRRERDATGPCA